MSGKAISVLLFGLMMPLVWGSGTPAQEGDAQIHVVVDLVQLNLAVTDQKGQYVTGLKPQNFLVTEDGIQEKIAFFGEGDQPSQRVADTLPANDRHLPPGSTEKAPVTDPPAPTSPLAGANVFILFDTSNYMYRGFVFAQDAIADFIRSLEGADRLAFYSYSRDLSRAATLSSDRAQVLRAVRRTVAGDEAALYNTLLLTVRDAARFKGRKVVVVFSNGPDNASTVPPEDVAELAQSAGIPIYMVSTQQAKLEPVSTAVFQRMTAATGGKAYFSKKWQDEKRAFASIRDDLAHLYSIGYYPKLNPNRGWRTINVKLVGGDQLKKCRIRTRNGYRLQPARFSAGDGHNSGVELPAR